MSIMIGSGSIVVAAPLQEDFHFSPTVFSPVYALHQRLPRRVRNQGRSLCRSH